MRIYILNIICFVYCFTSCNAQSVNNTDTGSFIKELEMEINNTIVSNALFNDTVTFELKARKIQTVDEKVKNFNWGKIKILFKGTDYVINLYNNKSNEISKVMGISKYYELKNHKYIYIIGINEQEKISIIREVKLQLPLDAPRSGAS